MQGRVGREDIIIGTFPAKKFKISHPGDMQKKKKRPLFHEFPMYFQGFFKFQIT